MGIVADLQHPPERKTADAWWLDDAKMTAKALEVGVTSHGKSREQLRADINDAIAKARRVPRETDGGQEWDASTAGALE